MSKPYQPDPATEQRRQLASCWLKAQPAVSAYVWSMVHNEQDAEDVIQNVAEDVAAHFDRYDPARPFLGWALGIARFKVIDYYRKNHRDRHMFLSDAVESLAQAYVEVEPEMSCRRMALRRCVKGLNEKARNLLDLRYDEGLKPAEIAESLNTTPGYIRVALNRVRKVLHNCVEKTLSREVGDDGE
ncbi:MAG: sigma-70 family RNA polymerase sigma factor [Phycisphaerales bacterium JB063]